MNWKIVAAYTSTGKVIPAETAMPRFYKLAVAYRHAGLELARGGAFAARQQAPIRSMVLGQWLIV